MTKTGWWKVKFDLTLEGEEVRFDDLSEESQKHILECIEAGCRQGEIIEETDDEEEEDEDDEDDEDCDYCCDECSINGRCERQEHSEEDD